MGRKVVAFGVVVAWILGAMWAFSTPSVGNLPPEIVWGRRGVLNGELVRPRAAAIDGHDRLYLVDFTARIQAYDLDGQYLGLTWTTPDFRLGRPSGLGVDRYGRLIVCDSHYHCVRIYDEQGKELFKMGGTAGTAPGCWGYVSDCVQDAEGFYYVSEFGMNDRITKLDPEGKFVKCWGMTGANRGQFNRLRALALSPGGHLYAADACNHRIQVFTREGEFVKEFGGAGSEPGQLSYPYDLAFDPDGSLYVAERGNSRVQKFRIDGTSLGVWGGSGKDEGKLSDPWALVVDRLGRVHVVDTENHRVQRVKF